jgi:hypothetical protein
MNKMYNNKKILEAQKTIKIIDNYIEDNNLLKDIENDSNFFPNKMGDDPRQLKTGNIYHGESSVYSPWMFWDGWWKSPADTVKKRLVQQIWEPNLPCSTDEVVGFEYWTRTYGPGQYLPLHLDEDTFLYERTGEFRCPVLGAVYYAHFDVDDDNEAGFLEIHSGQVDIDLNKRYQLATFQGEDEDKEKSIALMSHYRPQSQVDKIAYIPNRLIVFDAGMVIHGTTKNGNNGKRYIMGINVWHKDNPPIGYTEKLFVFE